MPAEYTLDYTGRLRCTARHISAGHAATTDVPASQGGLDENFSPTDLVVVGLGTCILTTMAMVGERHQLDLTGLTACMEKEMITAPARRIGSIGMTITLPLGLRLTPENRARLENAAQRCPVKQSLHPDIEIRVEFVFPEGCLLPASAPQLAQGIARRDLPSPS
jgi:putative redox protein